MGPRFREGDREKSEGDREKRTPLIVIPATLLLSSRTPPFCLPGHHTFVFPHLMRDPGFLLYNILDYLPSANT